MAVNSKDTVPRPGRWTGSPAPAGRDSWP